MRSVKPLHLASRLRQRDLLQALSSNQSIESAVQAQYRASNLAKPVPLIHSKHFRSSGPDNLTRQSRQQFAETVFEFWRSRGTRSAASTSLVGTHLKSSTFAKGANSEGIGCLAKLDAKISPATRDSVAAISIAIGPENDSPRIANRPLGVRSATYAIRSS